MVINLAKESNIRKYKRPVRFNIGLFIFGMVFVYFMAFGLFRFLKNGNVSTYVVNSGTLSDYSTFNAFAIRTEKVFNADKSGQIQLYAKECSRVAYGDTVYTVDETGQLKNTLASLSSSQSTLSKDDFSYLQKQISSFKYSYNSEDFSKVYDFKLSLESDILDSINLSAMNNSQIDMSKFSISKASEPGLVLYYVDGYEGVTLDSFSADMLDMHNYNKNSTKAIKDVSAGNPVYKLITDENWQLVMKIDDAFENKIKDESSLQIRFVDDSTYAWVSYEILNKDDGKYLVLKLPNSMVRYARDRFVKIEVLSSNGTGLKVPKSALVSKDLYVIPKDYLTQGGTNGADGFLKDISNGGNQTVEFVETDISFSDESYYYVDKKYFESGVRLVKPGSSDTYTVGQTQELKGVYNINRGFAVFVSVSIIAENDEYCVVKPNSHYGVKKFDYIVLNGENVKEDQIIH